MSLNVIYLQRFLILYLLLRLWLYSPDSYNKNLFGHSSLYTEGALNKMHQEQNYGLPVPLTLSSWKSSNSMQHHSCKWASQRNSSHPLCFLSLTTPCLREVRSMSTPAVSPFPLPIYLVLYNTTNVRTTSVALDWVLNIHPNPFWSIRVIYFQVKIS